MIPLLLEASVRSLVFGLLVWLVLAAVRPRNPHVLKTVWLGVLLASLAMPLLLWLDIAPSIEAPAYILSIRSGRTPVAGVMQSWLSLGASDRGISQLERFGAALYAVVVLALIARFALGLLRMWRIRRNAGSVHATWGEADDIRVSAQLCSPVTFGSTILLPAQFEQWNASKLAAVLCHERSHVRQKDCYVLWLARLHACVFWINPLAWLILRRLAMLAETTSDDAVVTATGDRPAYAELLLEIAASRPASTVAMGVARANVSARIERIISDVAPAAPATRWHKALSVALLLPALGFCAASLQSPRLALADIPDSSDKPRIVSMPPIEEQKNYYPPRAQQMGLDGSVKISIRLDAEAHLLDTQILDEAPMDVGFGAAAAQLVRTYQFANPTGQPGEIQLVVKFELDRSPANELPRPAAQLGG
jgi:bla regulator protein blaR1